MGSKLMSVKTILTSTRGFVRSSAFLVTTLALAAALPISARAATPVAVWDGDFTATQTGFTLNRSGNAISQDNSTITIDQDVGVKVDFDSAMPNGMTVLFRYTNLSLDSDKTMASSFAQGSNENSTGVRLVSTSINDETVGVPSGFHSTSTTYNTGATQNNVTSSMSSGVMAFMYTNGGGTQLYYINNNAASVVYSCSSLKFSTDFTGSKLKGCAIGGERARSGATLFPAATGMEITGIAIFAGGLTEAEMAHYPWPSDVVGEYSLTLDGTPTSWSAGAWKSGETTVSAPTDGNATINLTASTTLTIDEAVGLNDFTVNAAPNAVLTIVNGENGSFAAYNKISVESGVLQQGSASVFGATPVVEVASGATLDLNGFSVDVATAVYIAGAGYGNWPWALTSSGEAFSGTIQNLYLSGNATIGGANQIVLGRDWAGSYGYLGGYTLTKIGAGELLVKNFNTPQTGSIVVSEGTLTTAQWNCLNRSGGDTTLTIADGATVRAANQEANPPATTVLNWDGTLNTASRHFIVKNTLNGGGSTAYLNFDGGATANLKRDLTVTSTLTLSGAMTFLKHAEAESDVVVTVSGTLSASGEITVGAGVTLNLGTNRPTATFDVDDDATLSVQLLNENDVAIVSVTGQPKNLILYDAAGDVVSGPNVAYDSENGTIMISSINFWTKVENGSFDDDDNWSAGVSPSSGANAAVLVTGATGITVGNSYDLSTLAVSGSGDLIFSGAGSITAQTLDFSKATGRVEYNLPTGNANVKSGSNTLLLGGGYGVPTVASGQTLTLGAWGTADGSGLTNTYNTILQPAAGSTLLFSPGEGKSQKLVGFGGTNTGTTIGATNGTLVVDMKGGDQSTFFGKNSVRIDNGGIVSLEAQDSLGYSYADHKVTINKGGVLAVRVRDTLKRTVNFNGGSITIEGVNGGRGLDFYGLTMNVTDDSSIDQLESQSKVGMRSTTTIVNLNDGKTLAINANLYPQENNIGLTVRAADGQSNQNGVVQLNGYNDDPKQTFNGTVTVGETGKAAMLALNCEHENGTYVVNAASWLKGTGSVTGNGGVTLVASNSKLCGSLTVNNLTAASGGTYGDQWNSVAAKVATSYFAAGTQTIENGSFTIGADCVVTNSEGTADTTAAAFSIAANGNLKLEKSVTVAGVTVADGGTITLGAASKNSVPALNVAGDTSFSGNVNFIMDFGSASAPGGRTYTLMTGTLPNLANVSVSDGKGENKWKVFVDGDALKASSSGNFSIRIR